MSTGAETAFAGGWLIGKLAPAIGGLFGGLSLAMFWTPEKLREKGKIASVFIAGGISAMAGFAFTGLAAQSLGIHPDKLDLIIGLSWALGLSSIGIMNWMANFMARREHMDIGQVAQDINALRKGEPSTAPPAPRPTRRRARKVAPK